MNTEQKGDSGGKFHLYPTAGSNKGIFLDLGCGDGKNLRRGETDAPAYRS